MNDLLKKLNTLARAKLNDITPNLPSFERTPNLDRQVQDLRQRINDALDYEDQLQANAQALRDEVARLDALADDAVAQGRSVDARSILDQLKRAEQRLAFAESELRTHQRSAEELIQRVNMLEATVADAKAAEQGNPPPISTPQPKVTPPQPEVSTPRTVSQPTTPPPVERPTTAPAPAAEHQPAQTEEEPKNPAERYAAPVREAAQEQAEKTQTSIERISGMLREAQEKTQARIETLGELLNQGLGEQAPSEAAPDATYDPDNSVMMQRPRKTDDDDDLAQRLRRLSKPE